MCEKKEEAKENKEGKVKGLVWKAPFPLSPKWDY